MVRETYSLPEESGYRIIRRLGSGGEGTVFLVCHLNTEQLRAAKVLTNIHEDRRHELDMMKHLNHPGLPKVIDLIEQGGDVWLIMEYIQGNRLDQEVAQGISEEQIWSVACQLAQILMYLHTRKPPIWHLDIKPSNILIRPDKSLVLIDFGASIRGHPYEESGRRYGTRGFAAPEQMERGGCVDARTDLFGAGAVLYYCYYRKAPDEKILDGKAPERKTFGGNTAQRGLFRLSDRRINKVLRRCLAREPTQRYENSQQFYKAVCNARKAERACRQLYKTAGAATLLIFVMALLTVSFSENRRPDSQIHVSEASLETESEWMVSADSEDQEGQENQESQEGQEGQENQEDQAYQEYLRLLTMAGGMGFSQAAECYREAASLYPADAGWYLQLIDQVAMDGVFEEEEEELIKDLIYMVPAGSKVTALELLEDNRAAYALFSYRLGLAYWYYYAGSGGKSAAVWWFQQVLAAQGEEEQREETETAEVLARIGSYYGMLGSTGSDEEREAKEWTYWGDLKELWYLYRERQENTSICCEAASEILSFLILKVSVLWQNGESKANVLQVLNDIADFADEESVTEDVRKWEKLKGQYEAALTATERAYQEWEESE